MLIAIDPKYASFYSTRKLMLIDLTKTAPKELSLEPSNDFALWKRVAAEECASKRFSKPNQVQQHLCKAACGAASRLDEVSKIDRFCYGLLEYGS